MLKPGWAETRTCPMTWTCGKLCPFFCPSKHAKWTFLGLDVLSALLHCLPLPLSPWKQNKIFLINSRTLTLLPLESVLIRLPSIAMPYWSHVTSANKSAGWQEPFYLPAMERRRALWLPAQQVICFCFFIMLSPHFRSFLPTVLAVGEGNGTLLQYSCLENPMDGGAW